ncbi:Phorbol ester/diacylglycerol-binding protein unc-13, partial [Frankliniella fusca]
MAPARLWKEPLKNVRWALRVELSHGPAPPRPAPPRPAPPRCTELLVIRILRVSRCRRCCGVAPRLRSHELQAAYRVPFLWVALLKQHGLQDLQQLQRAAVWRDPLGSLRTWEDLSTPPLAKSSRRPEEQITRFVEEKEEEKKNKKKETAEVGLQCGVANARRRVLAEALLGVAE